MNLSDIDKDRIIEMAWESFDILITLTNTKRRISITNRNSTRLDGAIWWSDFKHSQVISPPIKWEEKELNENKILRIKTKNFFINSFFTNLQIINIFLLD